MTCRLLLSLALLLLAAGNAHAQTWDRMRDLTPKGYVAYQAPGAIRIDGRIDEAAWEAAPWTEAFVDIEGPRQPAPRFETRVKMLWDSTHFYVAARLEEPHVWGTLTERNSIIFYDNDFEIFIDPDGDNHHYYEFEINALGTIWELTLEKPYKDGGPATHGTNIDGLKSAVHVDGTLNDPSDTDRGWSVEVAIPWRGLARYAARPVPPAPGTRWRINFSRVEWRHVVEDGAYRKVPDAPEDNWVWSPQGIVDMHRPERWGYVQFTDAAPGTAAFRPDPTLPARDLLMQVYHAQKAFRQQHDRWAASLEALGLSPEHVRTEKARVVGMQMQDGGFTVEAHVQLPGGSTRTLYTNEVSHIWTAGGEGGE